MPRRSPSHLAHCKAHELTRSLCFRCDTCSCELASLPSAPPPRVRRVNLAVRFHRDLSVGFGRDSNPLQIDYESIALPMSYLNGANSGIEPDGLATATKDLLGNKPSTRGGIRKRRSESRSLAHRRMLQIQPVSASCFLFDGCSIASGVPGLLWKLNSS